MTICRKYYGMTALLMSLHLPVMPCSSSGNSRVKGVRLAIVWRFSAKGSAGAGDS
ncbi:MAG: hypothetical protein LBQ93_11955 [Treponema sp.]|nr:hypothetical protein [Treponema sp.]